MYCDYCNKNLQFNSNIYKGYDCTFCSVNCRLKISELNYKNDPKLSEYKKWYKNKKPPKYIESTLKRTPSIIEFQNRTNKNYPKYINYFYKKNLLLKINEKDSSSNSICSYLNISYKTRLITYIIKFISFKIMY
tara:strand:+ start:1007 stop:1408 length:402 start_codon:yes stop_codon:yes gene_type:complete